MLRRNGYGSSIFNFDAEKKAGNAPQAASASSSNAAASPWHSALLRREGQNETRALVLSAVVAAVVALMSLVRRGRINGLSPLTHWSIRAGARWAVEAAE